MLIIAEAAKEEFVPTFGHAIGGMLLLLLLVIIVNFIWNK
jgi:hypothetical protein